MAEEKKELCDTCGKADSNGVPCALMFKEGTKILSCTGHEHDPKGHAKLAAAREKPAEPAADKGGKKGGK